MKQTMLIVIVALLISGSCFVLFLYKKRNGETRVSIENAKNRYTFTASFDPVLTGKVIWYVDSCAYVLRKEKANFRIKTSDGELAITVDKQLNSPGVMEHIKKICAGIKDVIIQH